ncbi:MAG TPA: nucleotidyltransferase domain-containing protein, partial [Bacteroidales bacterium]|nr:nucleotidyltransferase domain-containing protein [Bacteroidales bacterium]
MDQADALNIAQKYAYVVNANFNSVKIILFGSYAKGNFNKDSDIDIAVILNDFHDIIEVQVKLMKLRRKIDSRIEPHPFREKDFVLSNP